MQRFGVSLAAAVFIVGILTLTFSEVATAAEITREQAEIACRKEVAINRKAGVPNIDDPAVQACIKTKMSGK